MLSAAFTTRKMTQNCQKNDTENLSVDVVCCILLLTQWNEQIIFKSQANSLDPDQTAPFGAV